MTLYRRHPDLQSVLAALMARDLGAIVADAQVRVQDLPSARERLVAAFVSTVTAMTASPLVLRILEVDPELLLPYVIDRIGETQRLVLVVLERYIGEGQRDGSIRAAEPAASAACLELTARGFIFSARASERACDPARSLAELEAMLDAYLTPAAR